MKILTFNWFSKLPDERNERRGGKGQPGKFRPGLPHLLRRLYVCQRMGGWTIGPSLFSEWWVQKFPLHLNGRWLKEAPFGSLLLLTLPPTPFHPLKQLSSKRLLNDVFLVFGLSPSYDDHQMGDGFCVGLIKLLPGGMILSGVVTFFFGFAYTAGIHSYGYLIGMQVVLLKRYLIAEILFTSHFRCSVGFSSLQDGQGWSLLLPIGLAKEESKIDSLNLLPPVLVVAQFTPNPWDI